MKYKDIDIKLARKCCKQHSYKDKQNRTVPMCTKCPLRRLTQTGHEGLCWFVLKSLDENYNIEEEFPLAALEYKDLMNEDISFPEEWENWIEAQETVE